MNIETQLRDTLHRVADEVGSADPPTAVRAQGMKGLAHARRRRQAAVLSAGLAVVLVAIAVPVGASLLGTPEGRVATPPPPPPTQAPDPASSGDIYGGPTRGSLAEDEAFTGALLQLPWADPGSLDEPDPPVEARRVVYAGDVAGGRWALVVGDLASPVTVPQPVDTTEPTGVPGQTFPGPGDGPTDAPPAPTPSALPTPAQPTVPRETDIALIWFVGPSGATPDQMRPLLGPLLIARDLPVALYNSTSGAFVAVAAPGDLIEISAAPDVAADASVSRSYVDAGTSDGVAVTALEPLPYGSSLALQYRVSRAGVVVTDEGYLDAYSDETPPPAPIELTYVRQPAPPADLVPGEEPRVPAQSLAEQVLLLYGLAPDQVDFVVHYVGEIQGVGVSVARLTLLTARLPSGAVLTVTEWSMAVPGDPPGVYQGGHGLCDGDGSLSPTGSPAANGIFALRCDIWSENQELDPESTLLVIGPQQTGGSAEVSGSSGTVSVSLAEDGVGIVAYPEGAQSVVIAAADGSVLYEVPIPL